MGDRTEYMREYMRARRANERLAAAGDVVFTPSRARSDTPSRAARTTEPGQEVTEPGSLSLNGWLILGAGVLVFGVLCFFSWRNRTPEQKANMARNLNDALNQPPGNQYHNQASYGYDPE